MIYRTTIFLLIALFIISCTKNEEEVDQEDFTLQFTVNNDKGHIFDLISFNVAPVSNKNVTLLDFSRKYDSIVVEIPGLPENFKVFNAQDNTLNHGFSNSFYLPGSYDVKLTGYKNDRIVSGNHVEIEISDQKDFLNVNWEDLSSTGNTGYTNFTRANELAMYNTQQNNTPSVLLSNRWKRVDYMDPSQAKRIIDKDTDFLLDYISELYAPPTYSHKDTENMEEIYNQNFVAPLGNNIPLYIWSTAKNDIVLMKRSSDTDPVQIIDSVIYAEPK